MASSRIVLIDETYCLAYWNNIVIVDSSVEMDLEHMVACGEAYQRLAEEYPRGIGVVVFARPGVPMASGEVLNESKRVLRALGDTVLHLTVVIESQGLMAQLLRSAIRGVNIAVRSTNVTIAEDIEGAVKNVAPHVAMTGSRQQAQTQLREAIEDVRRIFTAKLPRRSRP